MALNIKAKNYTMFLKSKPWGYKPDDVEVTVKELKTIINSLNDKIIEQKQIIMSQQNKIEKLKEELRQMHLEMSNLELPTVDQTVENMVLNDFKNYNEKPVTKRKIKKKEPKVDIVQEGEIKKYPDSKKKPNPFGDGDLDPGDDSDDNFTIVT